MICSNQNPAPTIEDSQISPTIEDSPIKIHPFLIDFGRAGKLNSGELRFVTLEDEYLETLGPTFIHHDIYLNALKKKSTIADYIKTLLTLGNYVDAVLTLSMCVNKIFPETENSQYKYYIEHMEETEGKPSVYAYLFEIDKKMRTKFNTEIGKLIQKREQLEPVEQLAQVEQVKPVEQLTQVKPSDGGKLVLRRQKNSKTRRHIRSKIHKKKTRKLNKKKSRKLNKKKSKKTKTN